MRKHTVQPCSRNADERKGKKDEQTGSRRRISVRRLVNDGNQQDADADYGSESVAVHEHAFTTDCEHNCEYRNKRQADRTHRLMETHTRRLRTTVVGFCGLMGKVDPNEKCSYE